MEKETNKNKIWKYVKWTIGIIVFLYIILVIFRSFQIVDKQDTDAKVKEIHSIRLTMSDVDGTKLPPAPDEAINNSTVEGIDSNKNYVRDDVERFIFEKYTDIKERAAWMQYARSMNLVMLKADSELTLRAIMEEGSRANICSVETFLKSGKTDSSIYDDNENSLLNMIFNTEARKSAKEKGYKNMTSSGPMEGKQCDIFEE